MVAARQQAAAAEAPRIARIVLVGSVGPSSAPSGPPAIIRVLFSRPVLRWMRMVPPLVRELQRTSAAAAFSGQAQPDWFLPDLAANLAQPKTQLAYAGEGAQMPRLLPAYRPAALSRKSLMGDRLIRAELLHGTLRACSRRPCW
jgi:pimeloyl-ACP methyl ester carboxylesterase